DHPELAGLPALLLGRTRIVPDLETARSLAAQAPGLRFVTRQGELLEADGSLTVGTHHAEMGILSRKSELRDLRGQVVGLDQRIAGLDRDTSELRNRAGLLNTQIGTLQEQIELSTRQAEDLRHRIYDCKGRIGSWQEKMTESKEQMKFSEDEIPQLEAE